MKLFKSGMFWIFFLLPMGLGITYYSKYASNQYQATAHFTIEQTDEDQIDAIGALTGLSGSTSSIQDALIIQNFIESREVIERTRDDFNFKELYAKQDKDWLSRLDEDSTIEGIVNFWQSKISVEFDLTSGIITLGIMAFTPEDSITIINAVLKESEELVNKLSEKSRQDSLSFARNELNIAERDLKQARANVRLFRDQEKLFSPQQKAESKFSLVENLEADRARAEAELESLRLELPESSPRIEVAKYKVSALKQQILKERERGAQGGTSQDEKTMSSIISNFEELVTEQGFAERSYEAALLNMKAARIEATKKQRYLTMIVYPQLPESPIKPALPYDYLVLLIACLLLWGILSLILASVRDHVGWG